MLTIRTIDDLKTDLLLNRQTVRNFTKSIDFPFDKIYLDIVTQIKTTEISSECVLFNSVQSINETSEFSNPDYWMENCQTKDIEAFWFFAQNGQGDHWLFDAQNKVYFYDHNQGYLCQENFTDLDLNFEKWLQFADLNKQFDMIYDTEGEINESHKTEYRVKLREISSVLFDKYPFII